jgi:hypothetical protein
MRLWTYSDLIDAKEIGRNDSETDTVDCIIEAHDRVSSEIWIVEKGPSNYQYI